MGTPAENIFVLEDGHILEVDADGVAVPGGVFFVKACQPAGEMTGKPTLARAVIARKYDHPGRTFGIILGDMNHAA